MVSILTRAAKAMRTSTTRTLGTLIRFATRTRTAQERARTRTGICRRFQLRLSTPALENASHESWVRSFSFKLFCVIGNRSKILLFEVQKFDDRNCPVNSLSGFRAALRRD